VRAPQPLHRIWSVLALAGLLALTGCHSHQAPADGLVPWTDEPAQAAQLAQSATFPTCQVSVLRLPRDQQQWGGVWNDAVSGYFMIENSGHRPCELPRPSRVTAATQSGTRIGFESGGHAAPAVVLDPGERIQAQLGSPYDCGKPLLRSTSFTLTFPTGTLHVPDASMAVQCGGALIDFSARNAGTSGRATATAPPTSKLRATIARVPDSVTPGDQVSYAVRLSNPTSTPISLDGCPSYQEGIKGVPSSVRTYQLNCDPVGRIGAHSSVSFAMQLPLPDRLTSGSAVLDWKLQVPTGSVDDGQFASAATRVE
jgi:hypothetical protein